MEKHQKRRKYYFYVTSFIAVIISLYLNDVFLYARTLRSLKTDVKNSWQFPARELSQNKQKNKQPQEFLSSPPKR